MQCEQNLSYLFFDYRPYYLLLFVWNIIIFIFSMRCCKWTVLNSMSNEWRCFDTTKALNIKFASSLHQVYLAKVRCLSLNDCSQRYQPKYDEENEEEIEQGIRRGRIQIWGKQMVRKNSNSLFFCFRNSSKFTVMLCNQYIIDK